MGQGMNKVYLLGNIGLNPELKYTKEGKPLKWLVENSWGDEKGNEGRWTILDRWFDEHVYTIIVHKQHVPAGILKAFEEEPVTLPAWYPGAGGGVGRIHA